MNTPEEELNLQVRLRPKETVSLEIPKDTLVQLAVKGVQKSTSDRVLDLEW